MNSYTDSYSYRLFVHVYLWPCPSDLIGMVFPAPAPGQSFILCFRGRLVVPFEKVDLRYLIWRVEEVISSGSLAIPEYKFHNHCYFYPAQDLASWFRTSRKVNHHRHRYICESPMPSPAVVLPELILIQYRKAALDSLHLQLSSESVHWQRSFMMLRLRRRWTSFMKSGTSEIRSNEKCWPPMMALQQETSSSSNIGKSFSPMSRISPLTRSTVNICIIVTPSGMENQQDPFGCPQSNVNQQASHRSK